MISEIGYKACERCMDLYNRQYHISDCTLDEGLGDLMITFMFKTYAPPEGETEETFIDRLERGKKLKRNLFLKEWIQFKYHYTDDC